jgi:WXXGXW repeat (2 copies)
MQHVRLCLMRLFALALMLSPSAAFAQVVVGVSITVAPPVLPVYVQPPIPAPGYIWTPGYWAYGPDGYFWVPGTWVEPPAVGLLWTPGYWGWRDGFYAWNAGYWGPRVGYYGGVNYGFGYVGVGYAGGYWNGGVFAYNRVVNNFGSVTINNTYNKTVINNVNVTRVSYNGGAGGTTAKPTPQELAAAKDPHTPATATQTQHQQTAGTDRSMLASVNNGKPAVAATSHVGQFTGPGVMAAKPAAALKPVAAPTRNTHAPTSLSGPKPTPKPNVTRAGPSGPRNVAPRTASVGPRPAARPAPKPAAKPHG